MRAVICHRGDLDLSGFDLKAGYLTCKEGNLSRQKPMRLKNMREIHRERGVASLKDDDD